MTIVRIQQWRYSMSRLGLALATALLASGSRASVAEDQVPRASQVKVTILSTR